jgi:MerR family mercuric resistance operon transcriptional regulator
MGLLKKPRRLSSGYRDYAADAVQLICFIKRSQKLGFTLSEIKTLIELRSKGDTSTKNLRGIAEGKIVEIDRRIQHLQEMRNAIEHGMNVCQCQPPYPLCLLQHIDESGGVRDK